LVSHPKGVRVFENRALRRIFETKVEEVTDKGENCIMRHFIICTFHKILQE
jgi:hypothetical protein